MATPDSVPHDPGPSRGFPLEILDGHVDHKYQCCYCNLLLRDPVQSYCGHRFCKKCVQQLLADKEPERCPACVKEGVPEDEHDSLLTEDKTFPDNGIKRELGTQRVHCINPGCDWKGQFKAYEQHEVTCKFRTKSCEHCGLTLPPNEMEKHLDPKNIDGCRQMKKPCPFECAEQVMFDAKELERHEHEMVVPHLHNVMVRLTKTQHIVAQCTEKFDQYMEPKMHELESKLAQLNVGDIQRRGTAETGEPGTLQVAMSDEGVTSTTILELNEKTIALDNSVQTMNRQQQQLLHRLGEQDGTVRRLQQAVEEGQRKITTLEQTDTVKTEQIIRLTAKINNMEAARYDGILLWKIPDFSSKRQAAVSGSAPSIYSPVFYTGHGGYKMCARIYLNGDGMGRGTHISLFFAIMRGEEDALLSWPFQQKVTLMILDQSKRENVVDAFRPDPTSGSFRRPTTDMNVASGCPLFMPLNMLDNERRQYVKDDVMFVKVMVDCSSLN